VSFSLKTIDESSKRLPAWADGVRADQPSQQRVLWMSLFTPGLEGRRGLVYCLVAEPGTTKTSTVKAMARRASLPFWSVLGSIRQPVDFMGCPVPQRMALGPNDQHLDPNGSGELLHMHYAPAGFAVQAALAQNGVILFDEANNMPPAVQSAMLRVLFEGVVGELELPPGIRMLLATNSMEDAAGGWDIPPALASRIGWLEWEGSTVARFAGYLARSRGRGNGAAMAPDAIDFREEERRVDERWDDAWSKAAMLVTGFLQRRDVLFHQKPTDPAQKAWPNSRTWDLATHALAGSFVYDLNLTERLMSVAGFVGTGAYAELYAYAKDADLPDPEKLLDGEESFKHNAGRLDRTAAVLTGCLSKVLPDSCTKRKERVEALWKLIKGLPDDATDVSMPHVVSLTQQNLMLGSNTAYQVLAKLDPVLDAAGSV
jgi:hypothetical protein